MYELWEIRTEEFGMKHTDVYVCVMSEILYLFEDFLG
jgi:hypothetical protein